MIVTMLMMVGLIYCVNQPEDPEMFQAGLSLNNCTGYDNNTGYDVEARIYIHGASNWDVMHLHILNGTQKDIVIEWEKTLTDVLVLYTVDGETKAFIYYIEPGEWRTILLI